VPSSLATTTSTARSPRAASGTPSRRSSPLDVLRLDAVEGDDAVGLEAARKPEEPTRVRPRPSRAPGRRTRVVQEPVLEGRRLVVATHGDVHGARVARRRQDGGPVVVDDLEVERLDLTFAEGDREPVVEARPRSMTDVPPVNGPCVGCRLVSTRGPGAASGSDTSWSASPGSVSPASTSLSGVPVSPRRGDRSAGCTTGAPPQPQEQRRARVQIRTLPGIALVLFAGLVAGPS